MDTLLAGIAGGQRSKSKLQCTLENTFRTFPCPVLSLWGLAQTGLNLHNCGVINFYAFVLLYVQWHHAKCKELSTERNRNAFLILLQRLLSLFQKKYIYAAVFGSVSCIEILWYFSKFMLLSHSCSVFLVHIYL